MKIDFKLKDKAKLTKALLSRSKKFRRKIRTNYVIAGDAFIQKIRERWYSGRNPDDTGLNIVTRWLYRSWQVKPIREVGLNIICVIANGMNYGIYHEMGSKKGIKKRTFVHQDIEGELGKTLFVGAVRKALKESF